MRHPGSGLSRALFAEDRIDGVASSRVREEEDDERNDDQEGSRHGQSSNGVPDHAAFPSLGVDLDRPEAVLDGMVVVGHVLSSRRQDGNAQNDTVKLDITG